MANPWAGEVEVSIDGTVHAARLTLGALAELEVDTGSTVLDLVRRFEAGAFSARDILAVIKAGLRGGGWRGSSDDLAVAEIAGGPVEAGRLAAQLLVRAFSVPGQE